MSKKLVAIPALFALVALSHWFPVQIVVFLLYSIWMELDHLNGG